MTEKAYISELPTHCQRCNKRLGSYFIDGKEKGGGWLIMCETCHALHGVGFGKGRGQKYETVTGKFVQ